MSVRGVCSLGLAPTARVWLGGRAEEVRHRLGGLLPLVLRPAVGPLDALLITPREVDEWAYFLGKHASRLWPRGRAWLIAESPVPWDDDASRAAAAGCGLRFVVREEPWPGLIADGFAAGAGS